MTAHRNGKQPDELAAAEFSNGFQIPAPTSLDQISAERRKAFGEENVNWGLVCIDDVNGDEANHLLRLDWERWGIRLVMSCTSNVAEKIADFDFLNRIEIHEFSIPQLKEYLSRRGKDWVNTDEGVRMFIRKPILARLYSDIEPNNPKWRPENEYDLLESFWKKIDHQDLGALRQIANWVFENDAHPVSAELVSEFNISSDSLNRLSGTGWLRESGDGFYGFGHTRLLTWAVAKSIISKVRLRQLDVDQLSDVIRGLTQRFWPQKQIELCNVPLDVLWFLLQSNGSYVDPKQYWMFLAAMERYGGFGNEDKNLYEHRVPALGRKAIPVLLDRIQNFEGSEDSALPNRVFSAIDKLNDSEYSLKNEVEALLGSPNLIRQELGLRLAARFPDCADPERVWQLHCANVESEKRRAKDYGDQKLSARALSKVCEVNLDWFSQRLLAEDQNVRELTFALSNMDAVGAKRIWNEQKLLLIEKVKSKDRRCLLSCVLNFRDSTLLNFVEEATGSDEELVGCYAIMTLCCFSPKRGLKALEHVPPKQFTFCQSLVRQNLFACHDSNEVSTTLVKLAAKDDETFVEFFGKCGDQIDLTTAIFIIHWLDSKVKRHLEAPKNRERSLWLPLRLVAAISGPDVSIAFRQFRDSEFENRLVSFASARVEYDTRAADHELDSAIVILKRISGEGITYLTNRMLVSTSHRYRSRGCELAKILPNELTLEFLGRIVVSDEFYKWTVGGKSPKIQHEAAEALAVAEHNTYLVAGIVKWGRYVTSNIGELRYGKRPMNDNEVAPAMQVFKDPSHELYANSILALGHSGREDVVAEIHDRFLGCECETEVALCCLLAMSDLAMDCSPVMNRLISQYRSGHHKNAVLMAMDNSKGVKPEYFVQLLPESDFDDFDRNVLRFVAKQPETAEQVKDLVRKEIVFSDSLSLRRGEMADELSNPKNEDELDQLWEHATAPVGSFFGGNKTSAVRALAAADKRAAYDAALIIINTDKNHQDRMPFVLLQNDAKRSVGDLQATIRNTVDKKLLRSIALAFRKHGTDQIAQDCLFPLFEDTNWKVRRAASFVCGYMDSKAIAARLLKLAIGDRIMGVCHVAQEAIRKHQKEIAAKEMVQQISVERQHEIWSTVDSVFHMVDPDICILPDDPIGITTALNQLPFCFGMHAHGLINKRIKKIKDKLGGLVGRWE